MTRAPLGVRLFRYGVLLVLGTFFLLPLFAMLEFSTRGGLAGGRDFSAWRAIGDDPQLVEAILISLQLAVLTSVLMLVLLRVALPGVRGAVLSASLLTVALVLGEFTLASLLNFPNLQVAVNLIGKRVAPLSISVWLGALRLAFYLLFVL